MDNIIKLLFLVSSNVIHIILLQFQTFDEPNTAISHTLK